MNRQPRPFRFASLSRRDKSLLFLILAAILQGGALKCNKQKHITEQTIKDLDYALSKNIGLKEDGSSWLHEMLDVSSYYLEKVVNHVNEDYKKRKHGKYTNNFPNTYHIKTQRTAIGEAIARGDRHSVMILLKCKLIDLNKGARDIDGTEITTISLALKKGHLEIAKLLLEYKNKTRRDLDITKQYPKTLETPLHLAMLLEAKNQENAQQSVVVKLVNALKKEVKRKLEKEAKTNKKTNSTKNVMNPAFNSFLIQDCEGRTPLEVAVGAINYKLALRKTLEAIIDIVEYKTKYIKTSDFKNNICKTLFKNETYKPYEAYSNNQIRSLFALTYHNTDSSAKSDIREKHSLDKFECLLEQTSKYLEEKHFRKILEEIRHACKDIQIIRSNHADKLLGITINYFENYKLFPRPPESISCINANIYFRLVYWLRAF